MWRLTLRDLGGGIGWAGGTVGNRSSDPANEASRGECRRLLPAQPPDLPALPCTPAPRHPPQTAGPRIRSGPNGPPHAAPTPQGLAPSHPAEPPAAPAARSDASGPSFPASPCCPPVLPTPPLLPAASLSRMTHKPRQSRTAPLARFGSPGPIPLHGSPETFDSPVPPVPHLPLDQHVPRDRKDRCDL